jgi:hypothetical protein
MDAVDHGILGHPQGSKSKCPSLARSPGGVSQSLVFPSTGFSNPNPRFEEVELVFPSTGFSNPNPRFEEVEIEPAPVALSAAAADRASVVDENQFLFMVFNTGFRSVPA